MHMQTTSGAPRVVRRKLADGSSSFTFSVVRNQRILGKPTHTELAKIGTFQQKDFDESAEAFWKIVDAKLAELVNKNILWNADRSKVENGFAKHIPRPVSVAPSTVEPSPESNYDVMQKLIREVGEKAEQRLRERGINL